MVVKTTLMPIISKKNYDMNDITNEELFKEIDLIQSCIERMARNSFMIKGWALTILAGFIAFLQDSVLTSPWLVICGIIIPILGFWYIDAYFLHTEKCYRKLYNWTITNRKIGNRELQYNLDPSRFKKECGSIFKVFISPTLSVFFGIPILVMIIIVICSFFLEPNSICCFSI